MITINQVKKIREDLQLTHIVIYGISADGNQHVASHGLTRKNAFESAEMGNNLKRALRWPNESCRTKPLPRVCENYEFWDRKKIEGSDPIPAHWTGTCFYEPAPIKRMADAFACSYFEPNR